jgi:hypothetical protein
MKSRLRPDHLIFSRQRNAVFFGADSDQNAVGPVCSYEGDHPSATARCKRAIAPCKPRTLRIRPCSSLRNTRMTPALEVGGVEFIPENGGGAGVRLRKFPESDS